jgi:hypothetical protein
LNVAASLAAALYGYVVPSRSARPNADALRGIELRGQTRPAD